MPKLILALIKGMIWTLLTAMFGLIPVWLTFGISIITKNRDYSLSQAVQDGSLLFFVMAITTAITVDYYFSKDIDISGWVNKIMFTMYPFVIGIVITYLYSTLYLVSQPEIHVGIVSQIQYLLIAATLLYATIAKYVMFLDEEKNHK